MKVTDDFRQQVALKAFDKLYPNGFMTVEGYATFTKRVRDLTDVMCAAMEESDTPVKARTGNDPPAEWYAETDDPFTPAPVKVPMRVVQDDVGDWKWRAWLASEWIGQVLPFGRTMAKARGENWLSRLSRQLGVPLVADWEDDATKETTAEGA